MHDANAVARKHERSRAGAYDVGGGDASASAAMVMTGVSGVSARDGGDDDDDVDVDAFRGLVDDYFIDDALDAMRGTSTSLPADTLDGAFWDENLRDLDDDLGDDDQFDDIDPTDRFLRDSPRLDDEDGDEVVNVRRGGEDDSARTRSPSRGMMSSGEIEALARVGDFTVTSSYLGPILDDSAVKFLENNPTYGKYGSPSPSSSSLLAAEFDSLTGKLGRAHVRPQVKTEDRDEAKSGAPITMDASASHGESKSHVASADGVPPPAHDGGGCGPPSGSETYSGLPQPQTRLERLRRWKEKRKNRNFNKVIRYQSRKACADNRPRIKGKFVKVSSVPNLTALRDAVDDSDEDDIEDRSNQAKERDRIAELGLDKGLRAPPGLTRMKTGMVASASMPDFSMYDTM